MKVYSKTIATFLRRVDLYTREILAQEFKVRVARTRFHLDSGWNYPIRVVAIDDKNCLGYFESRSCTIGINRCLMYQAKTTVIKDILRHELAHYFTYTERGNNPFLDIKAHGSEFKDICRRYGFSDEISSATIDVRKENEMLEGDTKSEKVIGKIAKLLSLANSDNSFEAELATVKANQLMIQHNLEAINFSTNGNSNEIEYYVKCILFSKRCTPRIAAISNILKEFFVYPVRTNEGLEVTGSRANIENADYIANYLYHELKKVWQQNRLQNPQLREKPFMVALANSYKRKLRSSRNKRSEEERSALIKIDRELSWATDGLYGGLSSSPSTYQSCSHSALLGNQAGQNLNINRGVSSTGQAVQLIN